MTREEAIKIAEELIPKIYKQPSAEDKAFTKSLREGMLVNQEVLNDMNEYFKTQPSFAEVWTDIFLRDWITE